MGSMYIVDRRLNPGGKSLGNRQRFMRRAKALIRKAVHESSGERSIKDADSAGEVKLPVHGVHEPSFRRSRQGGTREYVLPGNKEYNEGDTIARPPSGGGRGGSEGSPDGDGQDEFRFALSQDEFVDLFLEDLELPDLAKRKVTDAESVSWHRAGYSVSGSPANLAVNRTVRNRLFESRPKPIAQAVMFCLMDVSGSMTEHMKDLAKRFFVLLYIFLRRKYKHVEIVFIRHTHQAQEVDENTFFHSPETGGTVVST